MKLQNNFKVLFFSGILITTSLFAQCENMYYNGYKPVVFQDKNTKEICYSEFDTAYSIKNPVGPIFSTEHLTAQQLQEANKLKRTDSFHEEPSVNIFQKIFVADFKGTGYDKGHLAPNKDFSNEKSQYECFTLANMIPQTPENNRGIWSKIEGFTRHIVFKNNEGYVFTGPLFDSNSQPFAQNRTKIPTYVWKVIFIPSINSGIAIITTNTNNPQMTTKSISEFEKTLGYKLFQNSNSIKTLDMDDFRLGKNNKSDFNDNESKNNTNNYKNSNNNSNMVSEEIKKETTKEVKKYFKHMF
jgi:endonuclease G